MERGCGSRRLGVGGRDEGGLGAGSDLCPGRRAAASGWKAPVLGGASPLRLRCAAAEAATIEAGLPGAAERKTG
jgi:hypothetical protein